MKTRGRRTLLCAKLQKQICGYLSGCTKQERPPTLPKVVLNTNDKTLEEITNFPMDDPAPQPDAPKPKPDDAKPKQWLPVVGIGGKVIRWMDAPERDADPEEADLP
jgi:hypothetical protein